MSDFFGPVGLIVVVGFACGFVLILLRILIQRRMAESVDMTNLKRDNMAAGLMNCPDCGRKVSKMAPACPQCGRPFVHDGCDEEDYHEEKKPMWSLRLLYFIMSPFLAVGALLLMVGVALLGFGLVVVGLMSLRTNPVFGWVLIAFGVGIWLVMIFKGLDAMFGER